MTPLSARLLIGGLVFLSAIGARAADRNGNSIPIYVGTYTSGKSKGIYRFDLDRNNATLSPEGLAAESINPSFLALHPNGHWIYAVNEVNRFQSQSGGAVSAFKIDPDSGRLELLNQQPSGGTGPCHLSVDSSGHAVVVANYGGGSTELLPLDTDGQLLEPAAFIQHHGSSVNASRQAGPHAHCAAFDPLNRYVWIADLGLDQILAFQFSADPAALTPNQPPFVSIEPAGSGPRHLVFSPDSRFAYVINEMASSMTVLKYDSTRGRMEQIQTVSTLPDDFHGASTCAEIVLHPNGRFIYGSNRGHNSIAAFERDPKSGKLTLIQHQSTLGKTPRSFAIDPSGRFLIAANQDSDSLALFRLTPSGRLSLTGPVVECPAPVCVLFLPQNR